MQYLQVQEVLLVVSVLLMVILLVVALSQCTLMGRRRAYRHLEEFPPVRLFNINTSNAEAQTGDEENEGGS